MAEADDLGNAITDTLAVYLLGQCDKVYPDKSTCERMRIQYQNCEICADEILLTMYNYLDKDEQANVENIVSNGPPVCANKACPVKR